MLNKATVKAMQGVRSLKLRLAQAKLARSQYVLHGEQQKLREQQELQQKKAKAQFAKEVAMREQLEINHAFEQLGAVQVEHDQRSRHMQQTVTMAELQVLRAQVTVQHAQNSVTTAERGWERVLEVQRLMRQQISIASNQQEVALVDDLPRRSFGTLDLVGSGAKSNGCKIGIQNAL